MGMMKNVSVLVIVLVAACVTASSVDVALSKGWKVGRHLLSDRGELRVLQGELGTLVPSAPLAYIKEHVYELLALSGSEEFRFDRKEIDIRGNVHLFLQQYNRGIEVDGGQLAIHFNPTTRQVFAIFASVMPDHADAEWNAHQLPTEVDSTTFSPSFNRAVEIYMQHAAEQMEIEEAQSVYLVHEDQHYPSIRARISYMHPGFGVRVRGDAHVHPVSMQPIAFFPLFKTALNRTIYDMHNNNKTDDLPGTFVRKEGGAPVSDVPANEAYDNAGICYRFYKETFNRDSWDGKGAPMISSVHFAVGLNNAFWNGEQMVYGDGDNVTMSNLAGDLSVVCHELTHAVVQTTAGLRYLGQSGANNEAFADIFGASAYLFHTKDQFPPDMWLIGFQTYKEGLALRYMNNPRLDGISSDYLSDRYTGLLDNGGVHINSGISNLAYVLSVQGGTHPRQLSRNWVQGLGLAKAQQIYYAALTQYMMKGTNFAGVRKAAEVAAEVLYGKQEAVQISNAWYAVGVGEKPKSDAP